MICRIHLWGHKEGLSSSSHVTSCDLRTYVPSIVKVMGVEDGPSPSLLTADTLTL